MKPAPEWTADEFEVLLQNPNISDEALHNKLTRRTPSAIGIVRNGIHAFHSGQNISMLSKMMVNRLEGSKGFLYCPVCGITLA